MAKKDKDHKFVIETPQGKTEVTGVHHQNPGICPYCKSPIPLSSVVFHVESANGIETVSAIEMAERYGITIEQNSAKQGNTGKRKLANARIVIKQFL